MFVSVTGAGGMALGSSSLPPVWSCGTMEMATTSPILWVLSGFHLEFYRVTLGRVRVCVQ